MSNTTDTIHKRAEYWSSHKIFDEATRQEVKAMLDKNDQQTLKELFYRDLEFGTGGLRGIMGPGTNRMNTYNISKATASLAIHLRKKFGGSVPLSVSITYDSRRNSKEYGEVACRVLAGYGIKALITKELRPTPMLSFMVRHFRCQAGICLTASHNPPEYNGYKVYNEHGSQVIPPDDESIIGIYNSMDRYEDIPLLTWEDGVSRKLIQVVSSELDDAYFKKIAELSLRSDEKLSVKIVYTPLHGTGAYPVKKALSIFGFNDVTIVPEQEKPDGNFPTVKYPNPEEKEALSLAKKLAEKINAELVMATDPDTDRIGIMVREGSDFVFLNGNQLGTLLVNYMLSTLSEKKLLPAAPLVIKTIVTTDLQRDVCKSFNVTCLETLTGFKWIAGVIREFEEGKRTPMLKYVCGGEESYGFMAGDFVRDKDAVTACAITAEMFAHYKSKQKSCLSVLDELYVKFGLYEESLFTISLPGMEGAQKIKQMMEKIRLHPPLLIDGSKVAIVRDFLTSKETVLEGSKTELKIDLPKSDVLQFELGCGSKVSVRPSGTEPKIKFYVSVKDKSAINASIQTLNELKKKASLRVKSIEKEFVAMASS